MKLPMSALAVCLVVGAGLAMPDALAGQESQTPKSKEVSLTGCLVQGSGPSVFILENAKADPRDSTEKGQNYLLTGGSMSVSFSQHLNNEVKVDGKAEMMDRPAQPAGDRINESDLPKLTATKITHVASTCSSPLS
jgi:hypothetical protein